MFSLRIALIASNRHPVRQPFAGGLEAHVWHLARALAEAGHRVSLFAAVGSDPGLDCAYLGVRELILSTVAENDPAMPPAAFMADHHAYLSLMTHLAGPAGQTFDVIHNHSLHHLPVALAATLTTPMLCTLHTPPTPWLESALAITGGVGARFVAVSQHTARAWSHVLAEVDVVPNGVDTDAWALGAGGDKLVWFGRITPEKGPHLAIEAARAAGRALVLAGPISDERYFGADVVPHLDGTITYAGHLDSAELVRLVGTSAAALVTPMWDEPYGLVVAEALSCGTPVVAFARGGIPEILDERCGRLVPGGDVAGMAAAIAEAVSLPRDRVRARALATCSAATMLAGYLRTYSNIIGGQETPRDRLLRASPGPWPPHPGGQHLRVSGPPGDGVDLDTAPGPPRLRRGRGATA
jgi:glycosyltransferase involved in cell wall biosynthesis